MRCWLSAALALIVWCGPAAAVAESPAEMLPGSGAVPGWVWRDAPRTFLPDTLYEYIDGAADLYFAYGFREVVAADYVRADAQPGWVIVEVYDMGAPLHAFGVFGSERPEDPAESLALGAQAYADAGIVAFWQDRYYVKTLAFEGEDLAVARALAEETASRIPGPCEMPVELARLPAEGRVPDSERYVKTGALGHRFLNEVVSAQYQIGEHVATLHVADLECAETADDGLARLREFEARTGVDMEATESLGAAAFAVRSPYHGDMVAARVERFLLLGFSDEAGREALIALVARAAEGLRTQLRPSEGEAQG